MATNVKNADLREEIYRSKLSYCDLPRKDQRALPFPDLYVDTIAEIPQGFTGLAKVHDATYLPTDFKPPFQPFQLVQNGQVIASAFLRDGAVSDHGRLTERLGALIYQLVIGYSNKPNWSGYSYLDEMVAYALEQAIVPVLRFDERKTSNPFAFLTTNTFFAFEKVRRREAALATHRSKAMEGAMGQCQWSAWQSDQNEADNSMVSVFDQMCAEMDVLLREELERRDNVMAPARRQKFKIPVKMNPMLSAAIKYGLKIGLSGAAIAVTFGMEPSTITRVKNDVSRVKPI